MYLRTVPLGGGRELGGRVGLLGADRWRRERERQLLEARLKLLKEYLEDNLKKGFIVPSEAPYASLVFFLLRRREVGGGSV
jgi:hypothetical protein